MTVTRICEGQSKAVNDCISIMSTKSYYFSFKYIFDLTQLTLQYENKKASDTLTRLMIFYLLGE